MSPEHLSPRRTLLILEYHRVADDGPEALKPWRVSPDAFARHVACIHNLGIPVVTFDGWIEGGPCDDAASAAPSAIAITFDDAYEDFALEAWPVLRAYGFPAHVFVPTGKVGGTSEWDKAHGPCARILDWPAMRRLSGEGVRFGAHGVTHRALSRLAPEELEAELVGSREALEAELGASIDAIAYPYGMFNGEVVDAARGAGYRYGVTVEAGPCTPQTDALLLPRFEVRSDDRFGNFETVIANFVAQRE
jgi:peptidoglycan/xylan/chitin deacetylase (PgdA/CDA1 family)